MGIRVADMLAAEHALYAERNPASRQLAAEAGRHMPGGVPLHWMRDFGTPFPLFVREAHGAEIVDADGHAIADFCLGDTGAMFGHAPDPVVRAIREAAGNGLTAMMPSPDAPEVGALLADIFALPHWQVTQTASDANRAVIRWARGITGRPKVLVFEGCYHGQVDDAFVARQGGATVNRPGLIGQAVDLSATSVCVPFNDLEAVETALASGDIALVLTEPALTNTAMVLPASGFLEGVQAAAAKAGALFCLDETHTISTARGGYGKARGLTPDFLVAGKPVAGGLPAAVYGFSDAVAGAMERVTDEKAPGYSGMGTTLSGNMLALAAMRACLGELMTDAHYKTMLSGCAMAAQGLEFEIDRRGLPWSVTRLGARAEIIFAPEALKNGLEAAASIDHDLEAAIHMFLLNREVLVTPFHNMVLISPFTTQSQIDRLVDTFGAALDALL